LEDETKPIALFLDCSFFIPKHNVWEQASLPDKHYKFSLRKFDNCQYNLQKWSLQY